MSIGHLLVDQGASGDLLIGALIDAGADLERVTAAVGALGLPDVSISVAANEPPAHSTRDQAPLPHTDPGVSHTVGPVVTATRVIVATPDEPRLATWDAVRTVLEASDLDATVRASAQRVLRAMFEAEASVHASTADEVHLHEMGSLDTIVDVVAVCAALHDLGITRLTHGPINLGGGSVTIAHGELPVPPPAVAELLKGRPVYGDGERELTTPTGAALLATLAPPSTTIPAMTLVRTGRGTVQPSGSVLTLLVGAATDGAAGEGTERDGGERDGTPCRHRERAAETTDNHAERLEPIVVVEATVDDLEPQVVPVVLDRLRGLGAFDAFATPAHMKKGRTGLTITAIARPELLERLRHALFTETSTIGVRWHHAQRMVLARDHVAVEVSGEQIRIKRAWLDGVIVNTHPEFDDVVRAAERLSRPVRDVLKEAQALAMHMMPQAGATDVAQRHN